MVDDTRALTRRGLLLPCLILFGIGCHAGPPHYGVTPASDGAYPSGDAAAVYRVVLDKLYRSSSESPPFVVLWDSAHIRMSECWQLPCPRIPPHKATISREVIRDFQRATILTTPLNPNFGFELPVRLLSESDLDELTAIGKPLSDSLVKVNRYSESMPFWLGFRKRLPGAWGYTVLTRVGFDQTRRQALVQVMHRCGSGCGHEEDIFLEKVGDDWRLSERMLIGPQGRDWIDVVQRFNSPIGDGRDSIILGSLRYLGPDAHFLALYRIGVDSVKALIKDSLVRDQLPRRIRGTVTNHQTRTPIAFAQIFVRSAVTYPNPSSRVVADSRGRYEVLNPPLGGTMLEVQCPGTGPRLGATLDAPGLYVHAAVDTTINMVAPNIAPCWNKRRVHRLQAGWLESTAARSSSYPDSDAAAVYRAVLGALSRSSEKKKSKVFVLADTTHERCIVPDDCGSPKLALLFAQQLVDSETIRDFLRQSRARVTLRPDVDYGVKTVFLTGAERDYLTGEGDPWHESNGMWNPLWKVFSEAFPSSAGVTSFTRVGYNHGKTQALVEVNLETREEDRKSPEMILLKNNRGEWRLVRRYINKELMSGTLKAGHCVPTVARSRAISANKLRALTGEFEITEVETARNQGARRFRIRLAEKRGRVPLNDPSAKAVQPKRSSRDPWDGQVFDSTGKKINGLGVNIFDYGGESQVVVWDGGLDGYGKTLTVRRISGLNFFGEWHSSYGNMIELNSAREMLPNPSGFFCAVRR